MVFQILGMKPALGRSFASDEDQPDKNHVAILSAGLWQRRFGRDPKILGKTLLLDGGAFTIVGVAPPQFRLPGSASLSFGFHTRPHPRIFCRPTGAYICCKSWRASKPGISRERAQSEMRIDGAPAGARITPIPMQASAWIWCPFESN